ncbi:MAG: hypothetical protein HY433_02400 [Candidatus Liptonbacteria bacterium]|nr:hypothetical protein [Candidatus Liptonbacteria bacterium]
MTLIQPSQKSFTHLILVFFIVILVSGAFSLIFLYNRSVNMEHSISAAQVELRKIQTARAEIQDKIFGLSSDANLQKLSKERNLVKDKNPRYLEVSQSAVAGLAIR